MGDADTRQYTIQDLVRATGIARRTIRYYIQRELLTPPLGAGRGHYYIAEHLERLQRIRELQDEGLTLEEIRVLLDARPAAVAGRAAACGEPAALDVDGAIDIVTRIRVAEGLELLVSDDGAPPTPGQVRALARAAMEILDRKDRKGSRTSRNRRQP